MTIKERNYNVDLMRSFAIFLMVIFHFAYDLKVFGWVNWHVPNGDNWRAFRYVIITLFFICVGVGLFYSHASKVNWKPFLKRAGKIALGAAVITAISLVIYPQKWVYFGVLHFIFIACLCAVWFVPHPRLSLTVGLGIILINYLGGFPKRWPLNYVVEFLPRHTADFVPLFPWLGVVLLGIWLGHSNYLNKDFLQLKKVKNKRLLEKLSWPGKHSLIIYLVHQPILFAFLAPIHWWLS